MCQQIVNIGFSSQMVVIVTGAFTGAVYIFLHGGKY